MSIVSITIGRLPGGTLVEVLDDGSVRPLPNKPIQAREWTNEEVVAAANSDPDALPMTEEEWENVQPLPRVETLCRVLCLDEEEFAAIYHIPLSIIQDWEEYRSEPDQIGKVYLDIIGKEPDAVENALRTKNLVSTSSPVQTAALNGQKNLLQEEESLSTGALNGHQKLILGREDFASMETLPGVASIRQKQELSAEEFAVRYRIPFDLLQDWEQGRAEPDPVARAYLELIWVAPEIIERAFVKMAEAAEHARQELERLEREWAASASAAKARHSSEDAILAH